MLPSVLAKQLRQGLADYIETTFPMTNPTFRGSLARMLATKDSVFHEPYTAVRLPFRTAENAQIFLKPCIRVSRPTFISRRPMSDSAATMDAPRSSQRAPAAAQNGVLPLSNIGVLLSASR